jgi:hypothetical protein
VCEEREEMSWYDCEMHSNRGGIYRVGTNFDFF